MRIRVKPSRRRLDNISLNLASMIDVTFLLLIYFMVSVVFAPDEDDLAPMIQTQQQTSAGQTSDFQPQVIEVLELEGRPVYRLGARVLDDRGMLAEAIDGLPREEGMFIQVTDTVPVGFAMAAVQTVRDAGFEQVTYVPAQ